jgi:hypothetical protein
MARRSLLEYFDFEWNCAIFAVLMGGKMTERALQYVTRRERTHQAIVHWWSCYKRNDGGSSDRWETPLLQGLVFLFNAR